MRQIAPLAASALVIAILMPRVAVSDTHDRVFGSMQRALETCADCHKVPGVDPQPPSKASTATSFQVMADNPERYSASRMRDVLRYGHVPIAQMRLTDGEIHDLVAFIRSLDE